MASFDLEIYASSLRLRVRRIEYSWLTGMGRIRDINSTLIGDYLANYSIYVPLSNVSIENSSKIIENDIRRVYASFQVSKSQMKRNLNLHKSYNYCLAIIRCVQLTSHSHCFELMKQNLFEV